MLIWDTDQAILDSVASQPRDMIETNLFFKQVLYTNHQENGKVSNCIIKEVSLIFSESNNSYHHHDEVRIKLVDWDGNIKTISVMLLKGVKPKKKKNLRSFE